MNTLQGKKFYMLVDTINAVMGGMGVPGSILTDPPVVATNVDEVLVGTPINQAPEGFTIPQND